MFSNILEVCIAPIFRVTEFCSFECWSGWEERECFHYVGSWRKSSQSELWEDEKDGVGMSQWEWVPRMVLLRVNSGDCTGGQMWVVSLWTTLFQGPCLGMHKWGWCVWWLGLEGDCFVLGSHLLPYFLLGSGWRVPKIFVVKNHPLSSCCLGSVRSLLVLLWAVPCTNLFQQEFWCYWTISCSWGHCCVLPLLTSLIVVVISLCSLKLLLIDYLFVQCTLCGTRKGCYICLEKDCPGW